MSETAAFAPKERFSDPDQLGAIFVGPDSGDINVREAVTSGENYGPEGFIVTEDPLEIRALERYDAVKRVTLEETSSSGGGGENLNQMSKAELLRQPEVTTVEDAEKIPAAELRRLIRSAREAEAEKEAGS